MIPMLIYAQDEVGSITDELVDEVAQARRRDAAAGERSGRLLLHAAPQAAWASITCRSAPISVACCVGGDELWEHACQKLGIGHKEVTADGHVSLEEVECMGACSWAPAMQVNYDFHHDVTPEKLDQLLDGLKAGKRPEEIAEIQKVNC